MGHDQEPAQARPTPQPAYEPAYEPPQRNTYKQKPQRQKQQQQYQPPQQYQQQYQERPSPQAWNGEAEYSQSNNRQEYSRQPARPNIPQRTAYRPPSASPIQRRQRPKSASQMRSTGVIQAKIAAMEKRKYQAASKSARRPSSGRFGPARVKAVNQIVGQLSQYGQWQ